MATLCFSVGGVLLSLAVSAFAAYSGVGLAVVFEGTASTWAFIGFERPSRRWLLIGAGAGLLALVSFWTLALYVRATGSLPHSNGGS